MTSVKVAVRIRPFNGREKEMNAKLMMRTDGNTVHIKNHVSLTICLIEIYRKMEKKNHLVLIMFTGHMMDSRCRITQMHI